MPTSNNIELIRDRLQQLAPTSLEIIDDSHQHIGHTANQQGAGHYTVIIQSQQFNGLSRIATQRLVYQAIADLMPLPIHALCIKASGTNE